MKKLFLSFSTLMPLINAGKVTQEDLDNGFFMFGCVRIHAYAPGASGEADERMWGNGRNAEAYPALISALQRAEESGRAAWIRPEPGVYKSPTVTLNELLERHGMPLLPVPEFDSYDHSYPEMKRRINDASIPLEALY